MMAARRAGWLRAALALLLAMSRQTSCQDGTNFYYSPVERSFAQVQPPLFPNTRPATYYEQHAAVGGGAAPGAELFAGSGLAAPGAGLPSPNYNQNPSPFQLPTGRSQPPGQYYLNQADYTPVQKSRFRQAPPQNFQFLPSTYRPDTSHIHSAAYQHNPSRPETFLGQITLNNPDTDFLPANRFRNSQFDGNSLRNSNTKVNPIEDESESSNDDLFDNNRVTTYNPNKLNSRHRQTVKQNRGSVNYYNQPDESSSNQSNFELSSKIRSSYPTSVPQITARGNSAKPVTVAPPAQIYYTTKAKEPISSRRPVSTTEYRGLYELEPLLEDDIGDVSYRELMKNNQRGSDDVEVIKSGTMNEKKTTTVDLDKYDDSNPSASSVNADTKDMVLPTHSVDVESLNVSQEVDDQLFENEDESISDDSKEVQSSLPLNNKTSSTNDNKTNHETDLEKETDSQNEEVEYVDYYDEADSALDPTNKTENNGETDEEYESEENENTPVQTDQKLPKHFDIVTLKPNHTMVKDDNFKEFVDSTYMDHTDSIETTEIYTDPSDEIEYSTTDTSTILRQEVVSVVTTKSVVNGTISVPDATFSPLNTKKLISELPPTTVSTKSVPSFQNVTPTPNTTENYVVVASVQTSRSVSGARFLPFPTVEQDEKKQVLAEQDEEDENNEYAVTKNPRDDIEKSANNPKQSSSTESINDKLDSIQSELSSSVLSGNFKSNDKHIAVITESTTTTVASTPIQLFTLKRITTSSTTEKSAPEPLPVMIKKFSPHPRYSTSTTTEKPKRKTSYVTVKVDDLTGLLPSGYKPRTSYKDRKKNSTTTTTTEIVPIIDESINSTQARSSGITKQNKITIIKDDLSSLLPKDFKPAKDQFKKVEDIIQTFKSEDISKFLPPGFKLNANNSNTNKTSSTTNNTNIVDKATSVNISAFLPKDYKKSSTTTTRPKGMTKFTTIADKVDISAFLPKGFKLDKSEDSEKDIIKKIQLADVSNLLPPGYNASNGDTKGNGTEQDEKQVIDETETTSTTSKPGTNGLKVVFPSRPGNKPLRKTTSPKPVGGIGPGTILPTIQKGWPTRASTEFGGWPTPSTTPFSIDKLLEAQRNATATSAGPERSTESSTRRATTTTTSTTTPPPPSTTPGVCRHDCDIAATIKIVGGVKWVPELLDHHTDEWKQLAKEVKDELNSVYSKSDLLKKWFKSVRIDAFSRGSVLVDYFVELNEVSERLDTLELKQLFHKSLRAARAGSVLEQVGARGGGTPEGGARAFDPDAMMGDQPDEERTRGQKTTKTVDKSAGKLEVGKFVVDPAYTEFIVLPKRHEPAVSKADEEALLPQWGIAVIVIALASLLFVVIFGVTVLVNRQKSAKAKQPIPLSEDMLRELDKSHMGGYDDLHLKERELPHPPSKQRRLSTTFMDQLAYPGAGGDSWRSEWTPQLQQYMSHYTPDSGRGSQLYGAPGYGYGGSQLYGQTGGGGSQLYGYTGEYPPPHPRSHYSRRRSDYDSNF